MSRQGKSEMTNSPWSILLAVPAMMIGCFVAIAVGAVAVVSWAGATVAAWTRSNDVRPER